MHPLVLAYIGHCGPFMHMFLTFMDHVSPSTAEIVSDQIVNQIKTIAFQAKVIEYLQSTKLDSDSIRQCDSQSNQISIEIPMQYGQPLEVMIFYRHVRILGSYGTYRYKSLFKTLDELKVILLDIFKKFGCAELLNSRD